MFPTAQNEHDELKTAAVEELALIEAELQRREFVSNPNKWVQLRTREELWSGQRRILDSVRDHRKTAVATCHEVGKSFIAARVVGWWIDTHAPGDAFVVTTAPTASQVRSILWREIGRVHALAQLPGRVNQTEWLMETGLGREELVAIGRKPDEYRTSAFQGLHQRYMLVLFDEACGVPLQLWVSALSLMANDNGKFLAIGNPDDPHTEFGQACKPGSGYNVIHIGAFDTPNFTGEQVSPVLRERLIGRTYVEEMRNRWARTWTWVPDGSRLEPPAGTDMKQVNPFFVSKVLGQFPEQGNASGLIPIQWIVAAQQRQLPPEGESELGVDVGGGGDSSTGCHRHGQRYRVVWEDHDPDTMHTTGNVIQHAIACGARRAKVDVIGIGRGVVDRGSEMFRSGETDIEFVGINVGMSPRENPDEEEQKKQELLGTGFLNLRAELWWHVRTLFEEGRIDIDEDDEALAAELAELRYERTSSGKIKVESKKDMAARGVPSPNRADALMLAAAPPAMAESEGALGGQAVW